MSLYILRKTFFRAGKRSSLAQIEREVDTSPALGAPEVDMLDASQLEEGLFMQQGYLFESVTAVVEGKCYSDQSPQPVSSEFIYATDLVEPDGLEEYVSDAKVLATYRPMKRRNLRGFAILQEGTIYPFFRENVVIQRGTSDVLFGLENLK